MATRLTLLDPLFKINKVTVRDYETSSVIWSGTPDFTLPGREEDILVSSVSPLSGVIVREIDFVSKFPIDNLLLDHIVYLRGRVVAQSLYEFGAADLNIDYNWQEEIQIPSNVKRLTKGQMSGNLLIHSKFYDGPELLTDCKLRIYFYDEED